MTDLVLWRDFISRISTGSLPFRLEVRSPRDASGLCLLNVALRVKSTRRWEMYRWVWDAGPEGDISGGDVEFVRCCGECERLALKEDLYAD